MPFARIMIMKSGDPAKILVKEGDAAFDGVP